MRLLRSLLLPLASLSALSACEKEDGVEIPEPGPADDPLWDPRGMPIFQLYLDEDWEEQLRALAGEDYCLPREYISGSLVFENPMSGEAELYEDVGVRYRGHSSLLNLDDPEERVGFKLSFNEFVEGRRFHDLRKINLLGTEGDHTLMREHLSLLLMREMGVPAPRSTYALLYINDKLQGLFPNTEEPDDEPYLEHHFGDDSGHLYKSEGYCGGEGDFSVRGDSVEDYQEVYTPEAETEPDDLEEDLMPLIDCANEDSDDAFEACIPEWIDAGEWLTEIAVDAVLPDVDGLFGAGQNFMLYMDPATERFVVYPWDKDLALDGSNLKDDWDIGDFHPAWSPDFRSVLGERLIGSWREDYCAEVLRVAEHYQSDEYLGELQELAEFLQPYVQVDPVLTEERWVWALEDTVYFMGEHAGAVVSQAEACSYR